MAMGAFLGIRRLTVVLFLIVTPFILPAPSLAQEASADTQEDRGETLRVFLDCGRCDFDYLRREITWVDYVRDRMDADVHVLVTTRSSASGTEYELAFIGYGDFEGVDNKYVYFASRTDTDDEIRRAYGQIIRIGLLPYIIDTPLMEKINIDYEEARRERRAMAQPEDDPWNFWVFRASARFRGSGEERRTSKNINGSFSANRTTEAWKTRLSANFRHDERFYEYSDGSTTTDVTRSHSLFGQVVKSLGDHWGASIKGEGTHSTYLNQDLALTAAPGIEFNIYPYPESSRRQLIFRYEIGATRVKYGEVTIFDKTEEFLMDQTFVANYDVNQPWGEAEISFEIANYLHDFSKYHIALYGDLEFRITRGLSIDISGSWSQVRDQIYIPKRELTDEEVLLERRALETDYRYRFSIGLSYTFGSIFNNVVNPRFGGGRGGYGRYY
jgi:hypothetical protein